MKKILLNEKAFTLIEMMIVLLVVSVILLIALPNITKHTSNINDKGCKALIQMVQGQTQAYFLEFNRHPSSLQDLVDTGYITSADLTCPNGKGITIGANGKVSES